MILLDTNFVSLIFRQARRDWRFGILQKKLPWLLACNEVVIPGTVLQEVLSWTQNTEQFGRLADLLDGPWIEIADRAHHRDAALIIQGCARAGVQVGAADALIAAQAQRRGATVITDDQDFRHMAVVLELRVLSAEAALELFQLPADPA